MSEQDNSNNEKTQKLKVEPQTRASGTDRMLNIGKAVICTIIFLLTDFVYFGVDVFSVKSIKRGIEMENLGTTLSFYCYFVGVGVLQIIYGIFSSINNSICVGLIAEAKKSIQEILSICSTVILDSESVTKSLDAKFIATHTFLALYICLFISTLTFAGISYLVYKKKLASFLKNLPSPAIYAVMGSIGISLFMDVLGATDDLFGGFEIQENYSTVRYLYLGTSYGLGVALYCTDVFFSFNYTLPCFIALITLVANLLTKFAFDKNSWYVKLLFMNEIKTDIKDQLKFSTDTTSIAYMPLLKAVFAALPKMLTSVILNLIHINVNVPAYMATTQSRVDFNTEWYAQAVANLCGAFLCYPAYFINCYSVYLHHIGARERIGTIASGISILSGFLLIPYVAKYMPTIMGNAIMCYLGIGFLKDFIYCPIMVDLCGMDRALFVVSVCIGYFSDNALAFFFQIAAVSLLIMKAENEFEKNRKFEDFEAIVDATYIRVPYSATFITKDRFEADISCLKAGYTLDLTDCAYMDFDANMALMSCLKDVGVVNVIGKPRNFYEEKMRKNINFLA